MAEIKIAVTNESTVMTDDRAMAITAACQVQMYDVATGWALSDTFALGFVQKGEIPPPDAWLCAILDDSDQADALGYHELTAKFQPLAKCFARTDMKDGVEPSVTISHELCEMIVNPNLKNTVYRASMDRWYMREACDAVEADAFGYVINSIIVSDFVLPAFFDESANGHYDFLQRIRQPYEILSGGYLAWCSADGKWQQDFSQSYRNMGPQYAAKSRFQRMQRSLVRPSTRWA